MEEDDDSSFMMMIQCLWWKVAESAEDIILIASYALLVTSEKFLFNSEATQRKSASVWGLII
jgi:hypothetical protein